MPSSSDRMQQLQPYFFAEISAHIAELRAAGCDVIRLDIGAPDMPPAEHIIDALNQSAARPDTHGYQPYKGTPELRQAWATMYAREYGVKLDPDRHVVPLLGSKEGIFHITQAHTNPEDVVLVPDPGYPSYERAAAFAGAEVVHMPLLAENDFLPDLAAIPDGATKRAKLLWLNYPNNPTGAVASRDFFSEVVAFARQHDVLIVHDAPYSQVTYDGYRAPSILQVPGAKDVAVELNSLSKSHNMAGWRVGVAVGNEAALDALYILKSNIDTSHFLPVMQAAACALTSDQGWLAERNQIYQRRRDELVKTLQACGFGASPPRATLYIWARIPNGTNSQTFARQLLDETGVSLTPGAAFGPHGEGFVRVSVGAASDRVEAACARLREWAGGRTANDQ